MTDPVLLIERTDSVATVVLDRPDRHNALNMQMCIDLRDAFESFDADPDVRAVVVTARGRSFCAGADLTERAGKDVMWMRARRVLSFAAYAAIDRCSKPVIAAVHGNVIGSGGEIAMAADFIVGTPDTRFRFPEPHWGTVGATQRLQRVVGVPRAKELLFTNRVVDAEEALRLGLLTRLIDRDDLHAEARTIAEHIGSAPPLAMQLTKRSIDLGSETDLDRGIRIEMAAIEQNLQAGDWRAGVEKFTSGHRHSDD